MDAGCGAWPAQRPRRVRHLMGGERLNKLVLTPRARRLRRSTAEAAASEALH